ncbi:MAG: hypothetical protein WAL45_18935 [Terracidiphilus sp.]
MKLLRVAAVSATSIIIGVPAFVSASAQAKPAAAPAAPPVQLQTYTLPDKSASAGVPAGWTVKGGGAGEIVMSGPQGENIVLGQLIVARNGPFRAGQTEPSGIALTMPSSAKLSDKLTMIFEQTAAVNGTPAPQIKFIYGALLQVPAALGQCGVFIVSNSRGSTNLGDALGILCSLPGDSSQISKNILMFGTAPAAVAAQTAPIVVAVLKSYTIAPGWSQKILAPVSAPAGGPGMGPSTQDVVDAYTQIINENQRAIDTGAQCVDAGFVGPSSFHQAYQCGYLPSDF